MKFFAIAIAALFLCTACQKEAPAPTPPEADLPQEVVDFLRGENPDFLERVYEQQQ